MSSAVTNSATKSSNPNVTASSSGTKRRRAALRPINGSSSNGEPARKKPAVARRNAAPSSSKAKPVRRSQRVKPAATRRNAGPSRTVRANAPRVRGVVRRPQRVPQPAAPVPANMGELKQFNITRMKFIGEFNPGKVPRCGDVGGGVCGKGGMRIECPKRSACENNDIQRRNFVKTVEVRHTGTSKGYGVFATGKIEAKEKIGIYLGELIRAEEFEKRKEEYKKAKENCWYFMKTGNLHIDAKNFSNFTRFINHSCSPNLIIESWTVGTVIGYKPMLFRAVRPIEVGEELTFDYAFDYEEGISQPCFCGSANCKGWIGAGPPQPAVPPRRSTARSKSASTVAPPHRPAVQPPSPIRPAPLSPTQLHFNQAIPNLPVPPNLKTVDEIKNWLLENSKNGETEMFKNAKKLLKSAADKTTKTLMKTVVASLADSMRHHSIRNLPK